jgi:predicted DNA-binding protein
MSTQMLVRIPPELKDKVGRLAKLEGKNVSALVRELLENYVKDRDIDDYREDLWARIGNEITSRGMKPGDVDRAIREVRKSR